MKQVTAELHAAGVRVLLPYNPWDTGTRREPLDDQRALVALLKQTGGDGANGDANPNPNPDPNPNPNPNPHPDPDPDLNPNPNPNVSRHDGLYPEELLDGRAAGELLVRG